jgi:hypothetical protein
MSFAAKVLAHRSYRKRHLLGFAASFLFVLWLALWLVTAYQLNRRVDNWVETAKTNGFEVSFSDRSTDGTPLNVHVHLENFTAKLPHGGHLVQADEAVLYLSLWDWKTLSSKLRGNVHGEIAQTPFTAEVLKFGFSRPDVPPENAMETGFILWLSSMGLNLVTQEPLPLGNRITNLSFDLRVMGPPPNFAKTDDVAAWNEASGVLEFDQLDLLWGPLGVSAKGTVGLNPNLQPEGAFSGKVDGLDDTIDLLVTKGSIEPHQEKMLRSSISVLSRPSSMMGGSAPIVPISLQGGSLYLGPVQIMKVPPMDWPAPNKEAAEPPTPQP